ncbi:MAG: hypothetical protein HW419_4753, partial [Deltaproteobacteria bacterium]|nr:hypothetical protein [Deltaproteobacteria bacterium]
FRLDHMSIGIDGWHDCLPPVNRRLSESDIPPAKAQRRQVWKRIYFLKPLRLGVFASDILKLTGARSAPYENLRAFVVNLFLRPLSSLRLVLSSYAPKAGMTLLPNNSRECITCSCFKPPKENMPTKLSGFAVSIIARAFSITVSGLPMSDVPH